MKVADDMDDEAQRGLLVGKARVRVLQRLAEAGERFERVALGRRMVVDDPVERDVMPRGRGLLPEVAGRGAHFVRPVRGLVEALPRPEYLLDMRASESAELRIGDGGDNAVAGLSPRESGRREATAAAAATNGKIFIGSALTEFV